MTLERRNFLLLSAGVVMLGVASASGAHANGDHAHYVEGDMALGDPEAPVKIIEFASMTCPHCASFHNTTFPALKRDYIDTGKVYFVFREFPLDRHALQASMLARCAGESRFFGFIEVLFDQQPSWSRSNDPTKALARIGKLGGVGSKAFDACMADQKLQEQILLTRYNASNKYEIQSTPSFVVNGQVHAGALSIDAFAKLIAPHLN